MRTAAGLRARAGLAGIAADVGTGVRGTGASNRSGAGGGGLEADTGRWQQYVASLGSRTNSLVSGAGSDGP